MKKFFALVFICFVFFVASFSNVFFEKLVGLEGGIEVSFYCIQKNDGDVFSEVKNGDGYVYTAQIENMQGVYPSLLGCYGFSAKFDDVVFDEIMQSVQVLKTEVIEGVANYYGYVNTLSMFGFLENKKVNIQIAKTKNFVVVGSPIILGCY